LAGFFRWVHPKKPTGFRVHTQRNPLGFFGYVPGCLNPANPAKCFFVTFSDRSAATLIPLIKKWILPGTTILSDCWKAYSSLIDEGYIHETVNHSNEFVSDAGMHINNIESRWNAVKKSLPHYGTCKVLYDSYFKEYCVRRKYTDVARWQRIRFWSFCASLQNYTVVRRTHLLLPAQTQTQAVRNYIHCRPRRLPMTA